MAQQQLHTFNIYNKIFWTKLGDAQFELWCHLKNNKWSNDLQISYKIESSKHVSFYFYILYIYSLKYSYKYLNILKISTTYYNSSIYPVQTIYNWKTRINLVSEILFSFVVNGELNRWKLKGDSMKAN